MTNLDSRPTDRCPPPENEDYRECMSRGKAILGLADVASYLQGALSGGIADLANELGTQMRTEQSASEKARLEWQARVESKVDDVLKSIRVLEADIRIVASTVVDHGDAIEKLRAQHARNHPLKLSVVPPEQQEDE